MNKLNEGAVSFRQKDFDKHKSLFGDLSSSQKPHTLFIGCSDSRLVPSLITSTIPGELFIIRSVANIIPPYKKGVNFPAISSAIEYAVLALEVENIIVCGHHDQSWKRGSDGKDFLDVDAAIAAEHICLAANELGFGTCWVCNFNPRVIQEKMALREGLEPVVLLPLGYPQVEETDGGNKKRKSLKEITEWI